MQVKHRAIYCTCFRSPLGWMGICWHHVAVARLSIGHATREAALGALEVSVRPDRPAGSVDPPLIERLAAYAAGEPVDFRAVAVDFNGRTPFQRRVASACREVLFGQTTTYAALAASAGSPKAARAVGQCLASNRVPLIVPCHRVLGSDRRLGGFSAPGGIDLKRRLLELEGVLVG
jgi:methylated-DNA-[protein]-cysteine S-methyltransferase